MPCWRRNVLTVPWLLAFGLLVDAQSNSSWTSATLTSTGVHGPDQSISHPLQNTTQSPILSLQTKSAADSTTCPTCISSTMANPTCPACTIAIGYRILQMPRPMRSTTLSLTEIHVPIITAYANGTNTTRYETTTLSGNQSYSLPIVTGAYLAYDSSKTLFWPTSYLYLGRVSYGVAQPTATASVPTPTSCNAPAITSSVYIQDDGSLGWVPLPPDSTSPNSEALRSYSSHVISYIDAVPTLASSIGLPPGLQPSQCLHGILSSPEPVTFEGGDPITHTSVSMLIETGKPRVVFFGASSEKGVSQSDVIDEVGSEPSDAVVGSGSTEKTGVTAEFIPIIDSDGALISSPKTTNSASQGSSNKLSGNDPSANSGNIHSEELGPWLELPPTPGPNPQTPSRPFDDSVVEDVPPAFVTVGRVTFPASKGPDNAVYIGDQTIAAGSTVTINGVVVSIPTAPPSNPNPNGSPRPTDVSGSADSRFIVVVSGTTITVGPSQPSKTSGSVVTIGGSTLTIAQDGALVGASTTINPGRVVVIGQTTMSLGSSGIVVIGSSTTTLRAGNSGTVPATSLTNPRPALFSSTSTPTAAVSPKTAFHDGEASTTASVRSNDASGRNMGLVSFVSNFGQYAMCILVVVGYL